MALLFNKPPSDIETVNDLDFDVTNLFHCIQEDSERLARIVMTTPFSREVYDREFKKKRLCRQLPKSSGFPREMLAGTWVPNKWNKSRLEK
jgi:site-specific DNA-adenine methylase